MTSEQAQAFAASLTTPDVDTLYMACEVYLWGDHGVVTIISEITGHPSRAIDECFCAQLMAALSPRDYLTMYYEMPEYDIPLPLIPPVTSSTLNDVLCLPCIYPGRFGLLH